MTRSRILPMFTTALALASLASTAFAEPIQAGSTTIPGTAIQDITLLPGTIFNPGPSDFTFEIQGIGGIVIDRETQVGSTIAINSGGGLFYGSAPGLGSFRFGSIPPLAPSSFTGSITDVVQNPSDPGFALGLPSSFVSGNFLFGGVSFGLEFLTGPLQGIMLYTDPAVPFAFSAIFDGLPPSSGTVLNNAGAAELNILYNGEVIGRSSNRRIILAPVPEPSTLTLCGLAALGLCLLPRARNRG